MTSAGADAAAGSRSDLGGLLEGMLEAAAAAAAIVCDVYERPIEAIRKADGSPVTEADRLAEAEIVRQLAPTGIPILAEESASRGEVPALGERFFLVDPLDGTKEFLKRNGEFTVNIALIEFGRPVLGVVVAPALGEAYSGSPGGARRHAWAPGELGPGGPISAGRATPPRIVASRSHADGRLDPLVRELGIGGFVPMGSSLKFCVIARGDAEFYPRFGPTCEWDTAAGQAVLEAAGGLVLALAGAPLRYGKGDPRHLNPAFVAASDADLAERALPMMRELLA